MFPIFFLASTISLASSFAIVDPIVDIVTTTTVPTTTIEPPDVTNVPKIQSTTTPPVVEKISPDVLASIISAPFLNSNFQNLGNNPSLHYLDSNFAPNFGANREIIQSAILNSMIRDPDGVTRKIKLLENVQANVEQLFTKTIGRRKDGLTGEIFNQLRTRSMEKIFNLRFMLQLTDRLVNERNQLERIAELFVGLASKRTSETETLVDQIHRTAAELGENIKTDLTRVMRTIDGGIFGLGNIFSGSIFSDFEKNLLQFKI